MPGIFNFMRDFMKNAKVTLVPLTEDDREQFILDNQWAFKFGLFRNEGRSDHCLNAMGC